MRRHLLTFLIVEALFSASFISQARAYSVETHAFLTQETIKFYNQNFSKKPVKDNWVNFVIDGARREDDAPRWVNHFYDPVNNRGLDDGVYKGLKSKEWAQDETNQTKLVYRLSPFSVASILSAKETNKIKSIFDKSNFTWQKALDLYARGQTEKALYTLGHVMHLIQDASVPDHTRNDAHPPFDDGGSPYENWTKKFNLENPDKDLTGRLKNKKPFLLADLNTYFDETAKYSNNNFYSKDSINTYEFPRPDFLKNFNGYNTAYKKDIEFGDYPLGVVEGTFSWSDNRSSEIDKVFILENYWSRLSTKSVQYNAGVINLFFQEAEKTKAKYELEKAQRPFLSTMISGFWGLFGNDEEPIDEFGAPDGFSFVSQLKSGDSAPVSAPAPDQKVKTEIADLNLQSSNPVDSPPESDDLSPTPTSPSAITPTSQSPSSAPAASSAPTCGFNTGKFPTFQNLIINEVAWMGTANSPNDEWIELKNISGASLDISGWQIIDKGEQIKTTLEGKVPAGGFYLLERSGDDTLPAVLANQIYVGSLGNSDEGLKLFDKNCDVADQVEAQPNWPAGDNTEKRSMERGADFSWHTYSGSGENGILGTPKKENSQAAQNLGGGGGGGGGGSNGSSQNVPDNSVVIPAPDTSSSTPDSTSDSSPSDDSLTSNGVNHILISEILYNAEGSDAGKEFIELYNPTDSDKNLDGWSLESLSTGGSKTSLAKFGSKTEDSFIIKSRGFLLIGLNNYNSAPPSDIKRSGSLNNTGATISIFDAEGNMIDGVSYDGSLPEGQGLERKAYQNGCVSSQGAGEYLGNGCDTDSNSDWEARGAPNPQNSQNLPEPRPAPQTVKNFNVTYSSSNLELSFIWDASESFNNSTTTYHLTDTTGTTTVSLTKITSGSFTKKLKEIGRDYRFEIKAFDRDGLGSAAANAAADIPSFLSSLSFYPLQNSTATKYFLDLAWNQNPLIPFKLKHLASGQEPINNWQVLVFYKNKEAPPIQDIFWLDYTGMAPYKNWGLIAPGGFSVGYPNCLGDGYKTTGSALILPDGNNSCSSIAGNHASFAFNWPLLEDNRVSLSVSADNFPDSLPVENQDYISAAFYSFQAGYEPNNSTVSLVALDKTKYYFQNNASDSKPPTAPSNLNFEYGQNSSLLKVSWDKSTDPDSSDDSIGYSLKYSGKATTTLNNFINVVVESGASYNFELAAFDDRGNFSELALSTYEVPDQPLPFGITGIEWGKAEGATSTVLNLNFGRYPLSDSEKPLALIFFFNQEPPADYSFLDGDYRDGLKIGGDNSILGFEYYPCDFGGSWLAKKSVGGLIFNNADCPDRAGTLFISRLLLAKVGSDPTEFSAGILDVFKNGAAAGEEFSTDDYVTLGFYELGPRDNQGRAYFQNIFNYNKKIYFTRLQ